MRQLVTSNVEIAHLTKFPVYLWLGSEKKKKKNNLQLPVIESKESSVVFMFSCVLQVLQKCVDAYILEPG